MFSLTYKFYGEKAILIEWDAVISEEILDDIVAFKNLIFAEKNSQIIDVVIGYNSLTIIFKEFVNQKHIEFLKDLYTLKKEQFKKDSSLWKIPVCYDAFFGIDLDEISLKNNLTIEQIIHLHTNTIYTVYFIGFLPGFLYLGGLDSQLHIPRKATPRLKVEKGAVAIGGSQTGIYPQESAGGWNILGNSPISFFDVNNSSPCFATSGDKIEFVAIDFETYKKIEKEVSFGLFNFKNWQENG